MQDERKQDLNDPEESELERRIDEMLDPSIPDKPVAGVEDIGEVKKPEIKARKIAITHDDDSVATAVPELPSAPEVPDEKKSKVSKKIAVTQHDDEKAELAKAIEAANSELASKVEGDTPPLPTSKTVPKKKIPKTIAVTAVEPDLPTEEAAAVSETMTQVSPEETAAAIDSPGVSGVPEVPTVSEEPVDTTSVLPVNDTLTEEPELPDTYTDKSTSDAVDEIVAEEGDELLAMQDADSVAAEEESSSKRSDKESLGSRARTLFLLMWHSRLVHWVFLVLFLALVGTAGALPVTRYYALNMAGVRSSASIKVIDQSTIQPLKNVQVQLGGQLVTTGVDGVARFSNLRLGPTLLSVQKTAFATVTERVTIGWGSNPLGDHGLKPTGNQYAFLVTDFLSGKPIAKAEASMDQADAIADDKGKLRLTLNHRTDGSAQVHITANGYRPQTVTLDFSDSKERTVKMVPSRKEVFISKRSGKYDVYKIDVDSTHEELVLAGTGAEQDNMALVPHTSDEVTALVSTRDNLRNKDGFLLSTLTMLNLTDNSKKTVAQSEQFQIVGWANERLVYVQIAAGTSAASPSRVRLMSYNYKTQENKQLASSNYFNDVMLVNGKIYYAPSSTYQPAGLQVAFYVISPDGGGKQTVLGQETWNAFRTAYDHIVLSVPNQWYDYTIGSAAPAKLDAQPANLTSKIFVDSPDGKHSLWVDKRDGKGVLIVLDTATKTEKTLQTQSGLVLPVRWVSNNTLIYRIHTDQETADYVLNIDGGDPKKIIDVTNTSGVDKWYYY